MTTKIKLKLLRQIRHINMSREEIERFCSGQTPFDREREINALCLENLIRMVSEPYFQTGVFVAQKNDIFEISDNGNNLLESNWREKFHLYYPSIISTISLLVSILAFIKAS